MFLSGLVQQLSEAFTGLIPAPFGDLLGQVFQVILGLLQGIGL
jgi:hypothetical protein